MDRYIRQNIFVIFIILMLSSFIVVTGCIQTEQSKEINKSSTGSYNSSGLIENEKSKSTDKPKIVIWAWDTTVTAANEAAKSYNRVNPNVDIEVVNMAQNDVVTKLNTGLVNGVDSGSLPDIVLVEDYNLFGYITHFPGAFVDLTDEISPDLFMPFKLKFMMHNNRLYGVPYDSGVCGLFYRIDVIKSAGYTEQDMRNLTWDKYIEIGKNVKKKTGINMLPIFVEENMEGRVILQSTSHWFVKDDGVTLDIVDNPGLRASIGTIKDLHDAGIAYDAANWDDYVNSIYNGRVCSVVGACWMAPIIKEEKSQNGLWRVAEIPKVSGPDGTYTSYSNLGGASWCILNTTNKEYSIDFLKHTFASDTELINTLVPEVQLITTLKAAKDVPNYSKVDEYYGNQLIYQQFVRWGDNIPTVNYGLSTYEINEIVGRNTQNVLNGKDIDGAIQDINNEAKSRIK